MGTAAMLIPVEEQLRTNYDQFANTLVARLWRGTWERRHIAESQEQGEIFTNPPHLCVEILSRDDTMPYMLEKIDDYRSFGVRYVWIINPRNRKGYVVTSEGMFEAKSCILETKDPAISVPLRVLFE
jgi:Uma2 family endonuclease